MTLPFENKRFIYLLLAAVVLVNIIVAGVVLYGLAQLRERDVERAENQNHNVSRAIWQTLSFNVEKIDTTLHTISHEASRGLLQGNLRNARLQEVIEEQKELLPDAEAWIITNAAGNIVSVNGEAPPSMQSIADRAYFSHLKHQTHAGLVISEPIRGRLSKQMVIVFARRLDDADGKFAGAVLAPIPVSFFQNTITEFKIGPRSVIGVRTLDFALIARNPLQSEGMNYEIGSRHNISQTLQELVAQGVHHGSYRVPTPLDNIPRLVSFHRIGNAPLLVIVGTAEDEFLSNWEGIRRLAFGFICLFVGLSGLASWLALRFWREQVRSASDLHESHARLQGAMDTLKESQQRMEHLAYYDDLTDLPNRALLVERINLAIAQSARRNEFLAVCYIDVDGFKPINDVWGHEFGDKLLIAVAQRLQETLRSGDTVARMGGDEFVVLLTGIVDEGEIQLAVQRMLLAMTQPFNLVCTQLSVTLSVGVTIYPNDANEADALIRQADQALHHAKSSGKNRMFLFDPEGERQRRLHLELYRRLVQALKENEFCLHYQPKIDVGSGRVIGVEALLRWQHPEKGLLMPCEFLHVIDESDLASSVGEWVVSTALRQMAAWKEQGLNVPVSVNISGMHLQGPYFADNLERLLHREPSVPPAWLELEILETMVMDDVDQVVDLIKRCLSLGVKFTLDDFGTGYSSLSYLRRLPVSCLKIDRSFVIDMLANEDDNVMVKGIVALAKGLQIDVIAEGVETVEHGIRLFEAGCHSLQGYGIARPMEADRLASWLAAWQMPDEWKAYFNKT